VQDLAPADTGKLNRWWLEISVAATAVAPIELKETPGTPIPDFPNPGIERGLPTTSTMRVGGVEVSVDIAHTWIGDLRVSLQSPAGTEVVLHDGAGGSEHNLVRTFTATTTPLLASLAGQVVTGTWRLKVADRAAQDIGKLNGWRLLIKPPTA
jgi:subtilisin-like proprotein convertase family protein